MISRGEVVWCDFNPVVGSEQAGLRPALVVQTDRINQSSPCTIVVPFTTKLARAIFPTHVLVPAGVGGLSQPSVALCEQVRVIDQRRIVRVTGALDPSQLDDIARALRSALDL